MKKVFTERSRRFTLGGSSDISRDECRRRVGGCGCQELVLSSLDMADPLDFACSEASLRQFRRGLWLLKLI